ncbi:hypothetical protein HEB94_004868 [Actinopolymorpha pittospori]|uniref:Uncharacterized protein n=1 Tax=Actinopolymorpha pittospori TaxID=648752 RepID=A0A927N3Q3_9ACTN|nr:hypothetical protein [Actinopolymorpha pittospori]
MMGHTHVCTGLTAGAGLLPAVSPLLHGPVEQLAFVACCGALAWGTRRAGGLVCS